MCPAAGKHGKKRSCRSKARTGNERPGRCDAFPSLFWPDDAHRCLVDAAAARLRGIVDLYRVLNLGGLSGPRLFFRQLCFALLFAGIIWCFATQLVWIKTGLVALLADF